MIENKKLGIKIAKNKDEEWRQDSILDDEDGDDYVQLNQGGETDDR